MIALTLLVACFFQQTLAISSGKVSLCDAGKEVPYGCFVKDWPLDADGKPKRKECKDKSRIMAWATAPVEDAAAYLLYAGDDEEKPVTTYVPGKRMELHLRVRQYDRQYRGILLYAVDKNNKKVGDFDFIDRESIFHSHCKQTVVHASGEMKPYLSTWGFTAPKKGTGDIRFIGLLKTGVANTGDFWYTNELVLKEGTGTIAPQKWFKAKKAGQSCAEVCASYGCGGCDAAALKTLNTADKVRDLVAPFATCNKPYLVRCGAEGPTSSADGLCYYRDETFCRSLKMPVTATTCAAKPPAGNKDVAHRLCACTTPCKVTTTTTTTTTTTKKPTTTTTTKATTKPAVTKPACTAGTTNCVCKADNSCNAGHTCRNAKCVKKGACFYGDVGCPCELGSNACSAGLTCSAKTSKCIANVATCKKGELGCDCTEAGGCMSAEHVCDDSNKCVKPKDGAVKCEPGSLACECAADGTCNDGHKCRGNKCIRRTACLYGDNGCPCEIGTNTCASGLKCSAKTAKCIVEDIGACNSQNGELGCWCTEDKRCNNDEWVCDSSSICVKATQQVCSAGDIGCSCIGGTGCNASLECKEFDGETACVLPNTSDVDNGGENSASSVTVAFLAIAAAIFTLF